MFNKGNLLGAQWLLGPYRQHIHKKNNHKITQKLNLRQIEIVLLIWCYFYYFTFNDDASPDHATAVEPKDKPDALNHLPLLFFLPPNRHYYFHQMNLTVCWSVTCLSCLFKVLGTNVTTNLCRDQIVCYWTHWHYQLSFMLIEFWGKRCCLARGNVNEPEIMQMLMRLPAQAKEKIIIQKCI